ncbi:MAG: aldehyde dehydrogenase [Phycisphaerales bacterium]|nr:aldehyde dehydrogenase [Phycisphaerales bacterium]
MKRIVNFINGTFVEPRGGRFLPNMEPAIGAPYGDVADSEEPDVADAIAAAEAAFADWSRLPAERRSRYLTAAADRIESQLEAFASAESIDTGKPITRARALEIPRAIANLKFFAGAILHERGEAYITDRSAVNYVLRRPRGVCGLISPWNMPLYLLTWKIAPAIAVGNTCVAKPSELTPMTAHLLGQALRDVGLPPGVVNIVHGQGSSAGAALVADRRVRTISFTGGTRTGAMIAAAIAPQFKKAALEMGGKNPAIVFADSMSAATVDAVVKSAFSNQGQICLCGSRILVEASIEREFTARLVERTLALRIGDPLEEATEQGALVSHAHYEKVLAAIAVARDDGGELLCGGGRPASLPHRCRNGYFIAPTLIRGLGAGCRTNQEEIFGPVASIIPFGDEREAIEIANGTAYGLAASIWTNDLARAHRLAEALEFGTVWVNCWLLRDLRTPFGGVKNSGMEREGGDEAMRFFTEPKTVCAKTE